MASIKQRLYWRAPNCVKNWMASRYARQKDRERFGPAYERIVLEIAERDRWSSEQLTEYQRRSLVEVIRHAAEKVPYYRETWREAGVDPASIRGPEDLPRLPILEKDVVRNDPLRLIDETQDRRRLIVGHTSGTTGTPLSLYRNVAQSSTAFAYADARWHAVVGLRRRRNASISIGVHLVTAIERTRPPFWVHNRRWNQLYMSSYHLSPRYLDTYVDAIRLFGAEYIEGYPSNVYAIARYIIDKKLEPIPMKACFTTAETLFGYHRQAVLEAFGCRTYDQYGSAELVVFGAECEHGSMHLSPEIGVVEVVDDDDRPLGPGQVGQLICTSLVNHTQPFIRYRIGDLGSLSKESCPCGSPLPLLGHIEGRVDAVLITRDGRRIGRLDPVFKNAHGIAEAQIVQNDYDKFVIRIVATEDYTEAHGRMVINRLSKRVGGGDIRIETVDRIERTSAGKFKAVICNLPDKEADQRIRQRGS